MHPKTTKRLEFILCLMSSIQENSRQDLCLMDTLPRNQTKLLTQELFLKEISGWQCSLLNSMIFNCGEQMLGMHISKHSQKRNIVPGPEFEELQGHVLVMYKALYGTRSGGACWHDRLFDILQQMDLKPSKADPGIWMRSSKMVLTMSIQLSRWMT